MLIAGILGNEFFFWLVKFASFSALIPLITGLIYLKYQDKAGKILLIYLGFSILSEVMANVSVYYFRSNLEVYTVYQGVQIACIASIFHHLLKGNKTRKLILPIAAFLIVLIETVCFIKMEDYVFIIAFWGVGNIFFITLSIAYFYKILRDLAIDNLLRHSHFIIVCGILFNFSCNLLYFTLSFSLSKIDAGLSLQISMIIAIVLIITQLTYTIALCLAKKQPILQ